MWLLQGSAKLAPPRAGSITTCDLTYKTIAETYSAEAAALARSDIMSARARRTSCSACAAAARLRPAAAAVAAASRASSSVLSSPTGLRSCSEAAARSLSLFEGCFDGSSKSSASPKFESRSSSSASMSVCKLCSAVGGFIQRLRSRAQVHSLQGHVAPAPRASHGRAALASVRTRRA